MRVRPMERRVWPKLVDFWHAKAAWKRSPGEVRCWMPQTVQDGLYRFGRQWSGDRRGRKTEDVSFIHPSQICISFKPRLGDA